MSAEKDTSKSTTSEPNETNNKSGAHTQAGQQSQTGGGSRQHGQDRPAVGKAGSKSGGGKKSS
jgi:hypothetical protein